MLLLIAELFIIYRKKDRHNMSCVGAVINKLYSWANNAFFEDERIPPIRNAITNLNVNSDYPPQFKIVSGTLSYASLERESLGVELPMMQ